MLMKPVIGKFPDSTETIQEVTKSNTGTNTRESETYTYVHCTCMSHGELLLFVHMCNKYSRWSDNRNN